jgi:hypothetical protein
LPLLDFRRFRIGAGAGHERDRRDRSSSADSRFAEVGVAGHHLTGQPARPTVLNGRAEVTLRLIGYRDGRDAPGGWPDVRDFMAPADSAVQATGDNINE